MAAQFTSADLLTRFNQLAGRPTADVISDALKYQRLADAQTEVIADIAARAPWTLYYKGTNGSWPTLTTADNNVFTFGNDVNGDPLFPEGKVMIYPSVNAIPDCPWREGWDYLQEGTQIRIPNGGTYSGTLYWRGIAPVLPISGSNQPSIIPPPARILIVVKAVMNFAQEGNRNPALYQQMYQRYWGNPAASQVGDFARWMLVFKTQFQNGGAIGQLTGRDFAIAGNQWGGVGAGSGSY